MPNEFKRVKKFSALLSNFNSFSNHEKNQIKKNISLDFVKLIIEIVANIENGSIRLDNAGKSKLKRYKSKMQSLLMPQSLQKRKKTLQSGGFVGTLLTLLGTQLVSYLINKAIDGRKEI